MWMMWGLIALTVAMVVGPIMMIRPSRGMNVLAGIRTYAGQQGLVVRMQTSHDPLVKGQVAMYSLPLNTELREKFRYQKWGLEQKRQSHAANFLDRWDWQTEAKADEAYWPSLAQQLTSIPEGVCSVEINASGLGCVWDERLRGRTDQAAVDELKIWLLSFQESLRQITAPNSP